MSERYVLCKVCGGVPFYVERETKDGVSITPYITDAKKYRTVPERAIRNGWQAIPLRRAGK